MKKTKKQIKKRIIKKEEPILEKVEKDELSPISDFTRKFGFYCLPSGEHRPGICRWCGGTIDSSSYGNNWDRVETCNECAKTKPWQNL